MSEDTPVTNPTLNVDELPPQVAILVELLPMDENGADSALMLALGQMAATTLRQDGYQIQPLPGEQRGRRVLIEALTRAAQFIWTYHEETGAELSGLITIFGTLLPAMRSLLRAHARQVGASESQARPLQITAEVDGSPLACEVPDLVRAEAVLNLTRRYQQQHPRHAAQVTAASRVRLIALVPSPGLPDEVERLED